MGNQQSQSKDKTAQLWSSWSSSEQQVLKKSFESLPTDLPVYLSKDLHACLVSYLKDKDIHTYLEFAKQAIQSKDTDAMFQLFQHAVDTKQVSLQTFVLWITSSSVPLWFISGSNYPWSSSNSAAPLVYYLLNNANDQDRQKTDDMAWLNEDEAKETESNNNWDEKTKVSPSKISQSEFNHWIQRTSALTGLFQLVVTRMLMGKDDDSDLHKKRLSNTASPQIQQHSNETIQLFGKDKFSSLLNPFDYFLLTLYLPRNALSWSDYERDQRKVSHGVQHDLLFSSRRDGMSWQNFVSRMVGQGATLTVVKSKDGSLFGAYADDAWESRTDWYGNSSNFLFRLSGGNYGAWVGTTANDHYQYLCWGKKSLPNGLGLGGQFEYAGLWIDSDFIHGHSRAGPLCTTYASPQVSTSENFIVDEVEGNIKKE